MLFYIILFITLICPFIFIKNNSRACKVSFGVLWFIYAFRNSLSVDDSGYIFAYERINDGWNYSVEWTYKFISNFTNMLGLNYKFVFLFYATISFVFLYKAIRLLFNSKMESVLYIATFMGYEFVATISVMRQFLAASICFYALVYIHKNNKFFVPIILCILALLFHGGAAIAFPLIVVFYKKWELSYSQKLVILFFCVFIGYSGLPSILIKNALPLFASSYSIYSSSITGSFSSAGGTVSWFMLMLYIGQCIISLSCKREYPRNEMFDILEKGQLVYLGMIFILIRAGVANRLAFTFIPFAATLPYTFIARFTKKSRKVAMMVLIIVMFALYITTMYELKINSIGNFFPYTYSADFFGTVN